MSTIMSENVHERCSELPNSETRALFSCKICFEPYSKCLRCPISLNCGHTFCLVCIRKLGMNKSTIQCGICRKNTYANYKRLGKNIVLTELLEWMNILVNDIDSEPTLEEKLADEQQVENEWPGSQHFIGPANLEYFYEEVATFDALVHNWPTYGTLQRRLDKRVQDLRCEMSAVEAQLRQAGDTYRDILVKLEELRSDLNNQIASYQLEEQDGHISPFRDGDNWDFDDIGGWGGGGGGMASPPPVVLPMPVSDDSDRESANNQRERRRNNHGWNYNNNNRRPRRPQYHVLVLSDHPTSCQPLPARSPEDDWGSSSGWSDNEDDKENGNARGNIGDSLDINVVSNVTTKQQEGETENEKQKNKDEQESKGIEPEVKNQEEAQQSTSNCNSNNFRQHPPRLQQRDYRYSSQYKNWYNYKKNYYQRSNGIKQSEDGTAELIYYNGNGNVKITDKI
uniref:RING-type domain-containing protein n=1 Tax=Meloidogyne enterolobii TaxID=390850 RepID=A0A6V7TLN8_MELEN|nr:unnamed protein product [Meloidogyne enterolobii]